MFRLALLLAASVSVEASAGYPDLDLFLKPILDACVLPDLSDQAPDDVFQKAGWTKQKDGWLSMDGLALAIVHWPASEESSASCSVYSDAFKPAELNDWFANRIGAANSIPWNPDKPIAAWKIQTNGHGVAIYVANDQHPRTGATVPVMHILQ